MRELRIATWVALVLGMAALGCDDDGSDSDGGVVTDGSTGDGSTGGETCGPTGGECEIMDPTSCGAGRACLLVGSTAEGWMTMCFAAATGVEGTPCDPEAGTVQCAEGFACSSDGACRRWCCSDADCNRPTTTGQICNIWAGAGPAGREVGICTQPSNCTLPLPQTGCDDGEACNLIPSTGETICDDAGTATEGEECMHRNGCVAGHACIGGAGGGRCRQYCDMTADPACPDGFACMPLGNAPENVGVCIPEA